MRDSFVLLCGTTLASTKRRLGWRPICNPDFDNLQVFKSRTAQCCYDSDVRQADEKLVSEEAMTEQVSTRWRRHYHCVVVHPPTSTNC